MKKRIRQLLISLFSNPIITTNALEKKMEVSTSQLMYTVTKANLLLQENGIPPLKKIKGKIILTQGHETKLLDLLNLMNDHRNYNKEERQLIVLLLLLSRTENDFIGLDYLAYVLYVSRNTVTRDLKELKKKVGAHKIDIIQNNEVGFYLKGKRADQQKLLFSTVESLMSHCFSDLEALIGPIARNLDEIQQYKEKVRILEENLSIKLTLQKFNELLLLLMILSRTDIAYIDKQNLSRDRNVLNVTASLEKVFHEIIPKSENIILGSIFLLSSSFIQGDKAYRDPKIQTIVDTFIENLYYSGIYLENVKQLSQLLYQHMFPMYYRLLFGIEIINPLRNHIKANYAGLHNLVFANLKKVPELTKLSVTEDESVYITAIVASNVRYQEPFRKSLSAIVVCPYGMSVSQLLRLELKKHFPHIYFFGGISVSDFYQMEEKIDIVFSTVPIKTTIPVFFIDSNLEKIDFGELIVAVGKRFPDYFDQKDRQIVQLIDAVKRHANIHSLHQLMLEFEQVLYFQNSREDNGKSLREFLEPNHVCFRDSVKNYDEVLDLLGQPLISEQEISAAYIDHLKQAGFNEHIKIKDGIALPHLKDDSHVYSTAISLLKLEEPILLNGEEISIFILLAANERKEHVKAFEELFMILENPSYYRKFMSIIDYVSLNKLLEEVLLYEKFTNK
jgi:transcriptional antiterminator/mannitol/fructose-specific phosphotransferase system IIA component (Ntr-type)